MSEPEENQVFQDHLGQEADLETRDQEVMLVILGTVDLLVRMETLDTSRACLVRLGRKVFQDDLASRVSQGMAGGCMNQDPPDHLVLLAITEAEGTLDHQDHKAVQAHQASRERVVPARLVSQDSPAIKETKEQQDYQAYRGYLETRATTVLEGCRAEVVRVMLTVS